MDQLSAHLERGWDLAQRGDMHGAGTSARRALELDPDSPEVHNLLGFVSALDGDCDEAIEAYQQAILLDDSYVEAMLNAAELLVHPMGQYDDALAMCEQVLSVTDYEDEIIDALLLMFEATIAKGDVEDAKKILGRLPAGPYESASHNFLAGRALYEIGVLEGAETLLAAALDADPTNPEAHYYSGLLAEERGDTHGACVAFLRTRQLELELGAPPWAPNTEAFLMFTQKAIEGLDEELARFMAISELYIADLPGPEAVVDGVDPRALTLIDAAVVGPENGEAKLAVVPEQVSLRVFLYALNVMRVAVGLHGVQPAIKEALESELRATLTDLAAELAEAQELDLLAEEIAAEAHGELPPRG